MFKLFATWCLLPVLMLTQWAGVLYFTVQYNKELRDLQKFSGQITSIWTEQILGKQQHYNLCFDFDNYKYLGSIDRGARLSDTDTLYQRMRADANMTVYYQPHPFNPTNKSVEIIQVQNKHKVLYSISSYKHELLNMILILLLTAVVTTGAFVRTVSKRVKNSN